MLTHNELTERIITAIEGYKSLRSIFNDFYTHSAKLHGEQSLFEEILFIPQLATDSFDVLFVGRLFRFSLVVRSYEKNAPTGTVKCVELDRTTNSPLAEIGSFNFTESGVSDVKPPDADQPLPMDHENAACYLVLNLLREGIEK
ncbi:hypothetical protein [Desulfoferrobacter suflitae]|uniref:hypothetical protein n=1 Tax=Desulfoferrobacter suflitae TaxID=2865782 RepID=UPI002164D74D|nr:hypothetical protein [Desulfoferrobacter suflitae]MCK8600102.1 hypothetical protein [Desulfoferrobacter suflitae]